MKLANFCLMFSLILLILTLGPSCGGGSKSLRLSSRTVDSIAAVELEMGKGIGQIDATFDALKRLSDNPSGNLSPVFAAYSKDLRKLDSMAEKVASRNQSLRARAKTYFKAWEKEASTIKSERVQAVSQERRAAAQTSFDKMAASVATGKEAFVEMMDELRDIELYLSNDLTSAGVTACEPIAKSAAANSNKVKAALNDVLMEIGRVKAELSPGTAKK